MDFSGRERFGVSSIMAENRSSDGDSRDQLGRDCGPFFGSGVVGRLIEAGIGRGEWGRGGFDLGSGHGFDQPDQAIEPTCSGELVPVESHLVEVGLYGHHGRVEVHGRFEGGGSG